MPNEISIANNYLVGDPAAEAHERKVEEEQKAQFLKLRREARGHFDVVNGRRGACSERYWEEAFRRAKVAYDSGKFLTQRLGADHFRLPGLMFCPLAIRASLTGAALRPRPALLPRPGRANRRASCDGSSNRAYWSIFDTARRILERLPGVISNSVIDIMADTAARLLEHKLMRSHDLTGAVFQRLIADRKFHAEFDLVIMHPPFTRPTGHGGLSGG